MAMLILSLSFYRNVLYVTSGCHVVGLALVFVRIDTRIILLRNVRKIDVCNDCSIIVWVCKYQVKDMSSSNRTCVSFIIEVFSHMSTGTTSFSKIYFH